MKKIATLVLGIGLAFSLSSCCCIDGNRDYNVRITRGNHYINETEEIAIETYNGYISAGYSLTKNDDGSIDAWVHIIPPTDLIA